MGLKNNAKIMKQNELLQDIKFCGKDVLYSTIFTWKMHLLVSNIYDSYNQFDSIMKKIILHDTSNAYPAVNYIDYKEYVKIVGIDIHSPESYLKKIVGNSLVCKYDTFIDIEGSDIESIRSGIENEYDSWFLNNDTNRSFSNEYFYLGHHSISVSKQYTREIENMINVLQSNTWKIGQCMKCCENLINKLADRGVYHYRFNYSLTYYQSINQYLNMWKELFNNLKIVLLPIMQKLDRNIDNFIKYDEEIMTMFRDWDIWTPINETQFRRGIIKVIRIENFGF